MIDAREWATWGTTVRVVAARGRLDLAVDAVVGELDAIDRACSRFRGDSEVALLRRHRGCSFEPSPTLADAVKAALWAAQVSQGAVDPTGGATLRKLGYDRDFAALPADRPRDDVEIGPLPGWRLVHFDAHGHLIVPTCLELDFGATAKALAVDRAASAAAAAAGSGVLVSVGGDVAVAGPAPAEGWVIQVAEDHRASIGEIGLDCIAIRGGGVATSTTTVRRWRQGGVERHHILDPSTGLPAKSPWRTVTVVARSCLHANVATTAAIAKAGDGLDWLSATGLPARLVARDGTVLTVGAWP